MLMGGRSEGLAYADPGARTPIGVSGNYNSCGNGGSMAAFLVIEVSSQVFVILLYCVPILGLFAYQQVLSLLTQ